MTASVLQERETSIGGSSASSIALAFSSALTSGSSIHTAGSANNGATSLSCSGSRNGTYGAALDTLNDTNGNALTRAAHWKFDNSAAGSETVTVTPNTSMSFLSICIREIGGTSGYDSAHNASNQTAPGTGTDALTSGNMTPSVQPGCVSAFSFDDWSGSGSPNAGTGFTAGLVGWSFGGGSTALRTEFKRYTSTSALAATFTAINGTEGHITMAALFKESGVAAAPFKMPDTDERVTIKPALPDFIAPNLLADQILKPPPITQTDLLYKIQWKGVYTDFAPPNLLTDQILKLPPIAPVDLSQRIQLKSVAPDTTPTLILSPAVPSPYIPIDIGANVFRKPMAGDFVTTNLLTALLPLPPTVPIDATVSIRAKGVFTDFSPPNVALSTLLAIAPTHPQDAFLRLEYRWIRGDDIPTNSLLLAQAAVTPLLPQDISGLRLDARGLRSDFTPPNLTLFLPVPPPSPIVAAGRHGTRQQARRRRRLDVLRAKLEAFKEQRIEADRALMAMEDGELRARAKLLKRIRIKPLAKPIEEYAPIKKAIAQRTVVAERHRSILEQILLHQLEAERIQREIEAERDEEAAVQLMHFLMMELPWHE